MSIDFHRLISDDRLSSIGHAGIIYKRPAGKYGLDSRLDSGLDYELFFIGVLGVLKESCYE